MKAGVVVVPDASVLLKWVLESTDEENRDRALELREAWISGSCEIVVPSLWFFEVGNIVGMKQPSSAVQLMRKLTSYHFEEEPDHAIVERAFDLMKRFKVTFYDAAYHAVAINHSGTFLSADDVYVRKTASAGHIRLLADWSLQGGAPT
jgi:predicted nucleic acid-binding protein